MQTQQVEQIGYVYTRVNRKRKNPNYEKVPALKIPSADGSVLLKPLPAISPTGSSFITITLVEGVTVQLVAQPCGRPQEQKAPHNNGSAQCSALIIGMRKHACVGGKF
jgi:hypothetical protein